MRITKDYGLTATKLEHDLLARLNKVYKPVKKHWKKQKKNWRKKNEIQNHVQII